MSLDVLFHPRSVAVIGASRTPGKVGHDILANLVRDGFAGVIVPVNPAVDTLFDLPCYPSLAAWGKEIDLTVIVVPQAMVMAAVEDGIQAKTKAIIVITAGFRGNRAGGAGPGKEDGGTLSASWRENSGPELSGADQYRGQAQRLFCRCHAHARRDLDFLPVRGPVHRHAGSGRRPPSGAGQADQYRQ